jgi:hypothetical protein
MKLIDQLGLAYVDLRRWCGLRGCDGYEQGSCRMKRSERKNATCTRTRHTIPQRCKRASTIGRAGFGSDASTNVNVCCPHEALCNRRHSILNWLIDCEKLASALDSLCLDGAYSKIVAPCLAAAFTASRFSRVARNP